MASLPAPVYRPTAGTAHFDITGNGPVLEWEDSGSQDRPSAPTTAPGLSSPSGTATVMKAEVEPDASDTLLTRDILNGQPPFVRIPSPATRPRRTTHEHARRILRSHFANQLLSNLKELVDHCDEAIAARYAGDLLTTMRTARDLAPFDPFVDVVVAVHDALAFENRWVDYSPQQYHGAYEILRKLAQRKTVSDDKAEKAILALEKLGFDTTPFALEQELGG